MAISGTSNTELSTTFNEWRQTSNIIRQLAADTTANNSFSGTQTFDTANTTDLNATSISATSAVITTANTTTANVSTLAFSDGSTQTTSAAGEAIALAIALG